MSFGQPVAFWLLYHMYLVYLRYDIMEIGIQIKFMHVFLKVYAWVEVIVENKAAVCLGKHNNFSNILLS